MFETIFIDLDDTLIPNHHTYYLPQLEACQLICWELKENSPAPTDIIKEATQIQIEHIKQVGYISEECFPLGYIRAYQNICARLGREPGKGILSAISMATIKYFQEDYKAYSGIKETLDKITQRKILVTRGIDKIQNHKLASSGLDTYFSHIEIVPLKTTTTYLNILNKYDADPTTSLMIGDSIKNDIIPSIEAGMKAIHISHTHTWGWEGEDALLAEKDYNFTVIKSFNEVLPYLE